MYICPTCHKAFSSESYIKKHFLDCWKEQHPFHQSTPAPRSEDIVEVQADNNVLAFFARLKA